MPQHGISKMMAQVQAFVDKAAAAERACASLQEELTSSKQTVQERENDIADLKKLHSRKLAALQEELLREHRHTCEAQHRVESLTAQISSQESVLAQRQADLSEALRDKDSQVLEPVLWRRLALWCCTSATCAFAWPAYLHDR
jgi:peptidoglycan hydrolase CwlO-like protein